ncbi:MAG: hypothetical protein LBT25_12520 [Candidatus Symbiothrix sp.]|jgi:natural product precursor|nr:hypothetical protein [Candidatus Symbiothrix sp.]
MQQNEFIKIINYLCVMKTIKKIQLNSISEKFSEMEMEQVMGGFDFVSTIPPGDSAGGERSGPCPAPKRGCPGPHGARMNGGICCLGMYNGILNNYCYALLTGLNMCP